jgi:hypothetical protein
MLLPCAAAAAAAAAAAVGASTSYINYITAMDDPG